MSKHFKDDRTKSWRIRKNHVAISREKTEKLLQLALDASADGLWHWDLENELIEWSGQFKHMLGLPSSWEITREKWRSIVHPDDQEETVAKIRACLMRETPRYNHTYRMCHADGSYRWMQSRGKAAWNDAGKAVLLAGTVTDVTERMEMQQLLKEKEAIAKEAQERAESANMAKSEFLANMSHEIRTPMNAVIGLSTILAKSEGLSPKQRDYVRTLQLSADSLLSLINDLLDISKIEARSIELEHVPFSITQLLNEVISMMSVRAKEKGLDFTAQGECGEHLTLMGDPMRLKQIILNLCSNAIKFTDKGGVHISITCEASGLKDTREVFIAVSDTGIGIPPDKQEIIFQKFIQADSSVSRKYGGTGLGLAITKTLTEIMDGTIEVTSSPGRGSTFTVRIPLAAHDADNEKPVPSRFETQADPRGTPAIHRVLLVEDYPANVIVAGNYLESFGYGYDVVDNGLKALEAAKKGKYFAILMDVQMHGTNGFEATRLIRAHEKKEGKAPVPIIGMTAHALTGDRERCMSAGMDDYLSKPYNPQELSMKLAAFLQLDRAKTIPNSPSPSGAGGV